MAMRFIKASTFKRTVKVKLASPDKPDQFAHGQFIATFHKPKMEELEELTNSGSRGEDESRLAPIRHCLTRFLSGVEGIDDESGEKMDAGAQLEIVLSEAELAIPAHAEFWRAINSMAEVKKGN